MRCSGCAGAVLMRSWVRALPSAGGQAKWAGISGLTFGRSGDLATPWGGGSWGRVPSMAGDVLFADFIGQQHVVRLAPQGWPVLISTRCADFENVTVTMLGQG